MDTLSKRLQTLRRAYDTAYEQLAIGKEKAELDRLEEELARPEIWHNPAHATTLNKQFAQQQAALQPWLALDMQLRDMGELMMLGDDSLLGEFEGQVTAMEASLKELSDI